MNASASFFLVVSLWCLCGCRPHGLIGGHFSADYSSEEDAVKASREEVVLIEVHGNNFELRPSGRKGTQVSYDALLHVPYNTEVETEEEFCALLMPEMDPRPIAFYGIEFLELERTPRKVSKARSMEEFIDTILYYPTGHFNLDNVLAMLPEEANIKKATGPGIIRLDVEVSASTTYRKLSMELDERDLLRSTRVLRQ